MAEPAETATPPAEGGSAPPPSGDKAPVEAATISAEEIAALKAQAAEAATVREQLAALVAEKAEREAREKEEMKRRKIEGGDILSVLEQERAEKAALAERLQSTEAEATKYREREAARVAAVEKANKDAMANLPEEWRALVPEGLDPDAAKVQIERVIKLAADSTERPTGGRAAGSGKGKAPTEIPAACVAEAKKYETDPAVWFERIWKPRMARQSNTNN